MRRVALVLVVSLAAAVPAVAAPPAQVYVVGKQRALRGPMDFSRREQVVRVGTRRCRVLGATPLAALAATRLRLRLRDLGSCGRDPRDAGSLYVSQVGSEREKGRGGWVYKAGYRIGTTGAGDPSGPFGDGKRLRAGQKVLWFWCELDGGGACQRTLETVPLSRDVVPGGTLRVSALGYDDDGKPVVVEGATVRLGPSSAVSGPDGVAVVPVPAEAGRYPLQATYEGMVRSFPRTVTVP